MTCQRPRFAALKASAASCLLGQPFNGARIMKCELPIYAADEAEACGLGQSSDGKAPSLLISIPGAAKQWHPMAGQDLLQSAGISMGSHGILSRSAEWISSQRAFLAEILARQAASQDLMANQPGQLGEDVCRQLNIFAPDTPSLKTAPESSHIGQPSGERSANLDTIPEMESLTPPLSVLRTSASDGFCSRLGPTLLKADARTIGYSISKGRRIERLAGFCRRLLPTLCATDFKSPYSAEGYAKQRAKRSKPLRDTAKHTIGIRITPHFAEWWMGWPIGSSASRRSAMLGAPFKPQPPGIYSADP